MKKVVFEYYEAENWWGDKLGKFLTIENAIDYFEDSDIIHNWKGSPAGDISLYHYTIFY